MVPRVTRAHDSDTFIELLEPIRDGLYRFARRSLWHEDLAGDVVQEAMLTGWREFRRFELGTNFRAWMFRILVNTIYGANKKLHRRKERNLADVELDGSAVLEREDAWLMLLQNPDALERLLDERLAEAIHSLGEDERSCFLLRLLGDFSYKEISSMMRLPMGTAMSHVHRARMKMRESLAELASEYGLIGEQAP